ncbi:MAG: CHAT domain-containing protein, partial [Anaerolineae bacterium]
MTTKPVIFLAFANNRADPAHFLDKLAEEERRLRETLGKAAELCDVVYDETATADEILALFQRHRDRIAIFHFAGHANSYQLLLETADGQPAAANAGGFAAFLGQQTGLELVFLNGCSTQGQVEELLAAKVPAIIATDQKIKDDIATDFAALFYGGLATGVSIRSAFEQAKAGIRFKKGDKTRDLFEEDAAEATPASAIPWDLHALPDYDPSAWTLWEAAGNPLFGLPPLTEQPLPPAPFPGLTSYTTDQAELFFGRGAEIRRLFDWAVDDKTPPILLLHGQTGVGKSSLLAAGLRPRLTARQ